MWMNNFKHVLYTQGLPVILVRSLFRNTWSSLYQVTEGVGKPSVEQWIVKSEPIPYTVVGNEILTLTGTVVNKFKTCIIDGIVFKINK